MGFALLTLLEIRMFNEPEESLNSFINELEDDPTVFGLFVDWMHSGTYSPQSVAFHPYIHAKCWVLGDKLQCNGFKNYALGLLYSQHITSTPAVAMQYNIVAWVCAFTSLNSKLGKFYVDFVIQHFSDSGKLCGDTATWDRLLQGYPELRILVLESWRDNQQGQNRIADVKDHLECEDSHSDTNLKAVDRNIDMAVREKKSEVANPKSDCKVHGSASSKSDVPHTENGENLEEGEQPNPVTASGSTGAKIQADSTSDQTPEPSDSRTGDRKRKNRTRKRRGNQGKRKENDKNTGDADDGSAALQTRQPEGDVVDRALLSELWREKGRMDSLAIAWRHVR
ncbi:hypothetical protein ACHAPU_000934 [Fusarium lateritium]